MLMCHEPQGAMCARPIQNNVSMILDKTESQEFSGVLLWVTSIIDHGSNSPSFSILELSHQRLLGVSSSWMNSLHTPGPSVFLNVDHVRGKHTEDLCTSAPTDSCGRAEPIVDHNNFIPPLLLPSALNQPTIGQCTP